MRRKQTEPGNPNLVPTIGALGKKGEPISLAEEIALEQSLGLAESVVDDPLLIGDSSYWQELQQLSIQELLAEARIFGDSELDESTDRHELALRVIKQRIRQSGLMFTEGSLEILPDGFGFLRSPENNYQSRPDDVYVSPSQVRRFAIRNGSKVSGQIRPPKTSERYFALLRVEAINHQDPNRQKFQPRFEEMVSIPPSEPIPLPVEDFDPKIEEFLASFTYGSKNLITGPSPEKNTGFLKKLVKSAMRHDPNLLIYVLLFEHPEEEIEAYREELQGSRCEVIGTCPGETTGRFVHLTDFILDKAKRMVEYGKNVLLCVDSVSPLLSKVPSRSSDLLDFESPHRVIQAAKKTEKGSLTLLITAHDESELSLESTFYGEFTKLGGNRIEGQ